MAAEAESPKLEVTAAKSTVNGLLIQVNGFWAAVESQRWLLEIPICILIDSQQSKGYFAENFSAYWPGDPTENNAPHKMTGGTESLVVACLLEEYLVLNSVDDIDMPVPSAVEAAGRLRQLPYTVLASSPRKGMRTRAFPRARTTQVASVASRARSLAHYQEVRRRHAAGESLRAIKKATGLARATVRRFARAESFPERAVRAP